MNCETCVWFVPKELLEIAGDCRRRAPSFGGFPVVKEDYSCGEYLEDDGIEDED